MIALVTYRCKCKYRHRKKQIKKKLLFYTLFLILINPLKSPRAKYWPSFVQLKKKDTQHTHSSGYTTKFLKSSAPWPRKISEALSSSLLKVVNIVLLVISAKSLSELYKCTHLQAVTLEGTLCFWTDFCSGDHKPLGTHRNTCLYTCTIH